MSKKLLVVVALVAACGDDSTAPVAVYDLPESGAIAWGKAPFPNDLFRDADGNVEIAALPSTTPMWETVRMSLQKRKGFCGSCAIHFPIKGAIDPATLEGNVILIDDAGAKVPIDVEWDGVNSVIALRAKRGHVLDGGKKYVVGLTDGIKGTDGQALRESSGLRSTRAKAITGPAVAALQSAGVTGKIVDVTAFTVEDLMPFAADLAKRVKDYYAANGAPTITVTRVWKASDGTLTDLLGTPIANLPGLDNPAVANSGGTYAIRHETTAFVIKGTFNAPRVITGTGKELGTLKDDTTDGGQIPFLLAIPSGGDITHLPLLIFGHGAGGLLAQQLTLADTAGKAHAAVLSIETFQHGERSTDAVDTIHDLRGDDGTLGPDGFFEHQALTVGLHLFGASDVPADQKASPLYFASSIAQMAAEEHALLQLATTSDLAPIAAADASLAGIAFDKNQIYYLGISLGTVYGSLLLAGDTTIKAAVLNVALGGFTECFVENQSFRTQAELLLLGSLDIPNDEYEPDRHLMMQPSIAMFEWATSTADEVNFAKALAARTDRDTLWQIAGLDELAGTPSSEGVVAVSGAPAVGDYQDATVTPGTAPLQHVGAWLYPIADHTMLGYLKGSSKVEPPGLPPFIPRPAPLLFDNPIGAVHDQITHFIDTRRTTGTAEIR